MSPARLAALSFLALIVALPVTQAALELGRGERLQIADVWGPFWEADLERRAERLGAFEEDLRTASFVHRHAVPRYQLALTRLFGRGNEKAVEGRDGYLFYADDLDLVAGPGFLRRGTGGARALEVIGGFQRELAARGIELLVVPVPIKGTLDADRIQVPRPSAGTAPPRNPDAAALYAELRERGISHVELLDEMLAMGAEEPGGLYLPRDTHWRPEVMERVAALVAERVRLVLGEEAPAGEDRRFRREPHAVAGDGDLVRMLRLPAGQSAWEPMQLEVRRVVEATTGAPVTADPNADVLLLGDSYTRVFSDPELGLGEGAGLGEQLAWELDRPIDVIALLGGSATAVRESLARRPGGLDQKRLVIWELGMRLFGEGPDSWRDVPLPETGGDGTAAALIQAAVVRAELVEVSQIPEDFDYAFCLVIHEYAVRAVEAGELEAETIWVAFPGMVDFELTAEHDFAVGSLQRLVLEPIEEHHDLEETSWVDDTDAGLTILWATEWSPAD